MTVSKNKHLLISNYFKLAFLFGITEGLTDYLNIMHSLEGRLESLEELGLFVEETSNEKKELIEQIQAYKEPLEFYTSLINTVLSLKTEIYRGFVGLFKPGSTCQDQQDETESIQYLHLN